MKILVLCSGGDAPGMNYFLYSFLKNNKLNQVYGCVAGFRGLIQGDFVEISAKQAKVYQNIAGSFIKTSRCPEFKTKEGVKKAIKNIKENQFDCLVVLGGDGTYKGCKELVENNINVIFVPATIDKDLCYDTYSIGFLTAVFACCENITQVMNSFYSLDRTGVFEVMGRHNSSICKLVADIVEADMCICNDNIENYNIISLDKENKSQVIVVQENLLDINNLCKDLQEYLQTEVRASIVGYIQRGMDPLHEEKLLCKQLATYSTKLLKQKTFNVAVKLTDDQVSFEKF